MSKIFVEYQIKVFFLAVSFLVSMNLLLSIQLYTDGWVTAVLQVLFSLLRGVVITISGIVIMFKQID